MLANLHRDKRLGSRRDLWISGETSRFKIFRLKNDFLTQCDKRCENRLLALNTNMDPLLSVNCCSTLKCLRWMLIPSTCCTRLL